MNHFEDNIEYEVLSFSFIAVPLIKIGGGHISSVYLFIYKLYTCTGL